MIIGNTSLEEGDLLNLTCRVESFPLSRVTWTKLGSSVNLNSEMNSGRQSNEVSATLLIRNVMAEHSGWYTCEAQYINTTVTVMANVTVTREWTASFLDLNVMVIDIRKLSANPELTVVEETEIGNRSRTSGKQVFVYFTKLRLKSQFPRKSDIRNSLETKMST